jgi:HEAT repeat protein
MGDHRMWWNSKDDDGGPTNCRPGPVEVELDVRRGEVRDVDVIRDRNERTPGAVDLGEVSAPAAVAYFLELAEEGTHGAGEDVIFPAVLADVQDLWVELLAMARQESVRMGVRKSALFWVGQEAADAATEGLADLAFDEDEDQDVREAAVFALSQRPADEAVPILMQLARTAEQAGTRRSAMFWLAQSEDERVLAFFEEVLLGRGGA